MYNYRSITANIGRTYRRYRGNLLAAFVLTVGILLAVAAVIAIVAGIWYALCWIVVFAWNLIAPENLEIGMSHAFGFWILVYVFMWVSGRKSSRRTRTVIIRTRR